MKQASRQHQARVAAVQQQVTGYYKREEKVRVYHGNTNSTRQMGVGTPRVDLSSLSNIIEINVSEMYAIVEPNVALDQLLDATLKYNLMPPVVSEFPGITIGGAILGGAGESSSFKWGGVHEAALEYEVVLGDGSVVTASATRNADLFWGLPCSCGSLGLLTLVKIKLVPAKPYVRLTYEKVNDWSEATDLIRAASKTAVDFVDGIVFSKDKSVIMTGVFSEAVDLPHASFHRRRDEWFYLHADKVTNAGQYYEELIPIKEYVFRYDIGGFWVARDGFNVLHWPFNRPSRFLTHRLFTTRNLYRFLHGSGLAQRFMIQDICLPENQVVPFLKFIDRQLTIYPLWLCPLKTDTKHRLSPMFLQTKLVINIGTWGDLRQNYEQSVRNNRLLERWVHHAGGRKVFYAHAYYSGAEFWSIYDKKDYDDLRAAYRASVTFPDVYHKVTVTKPYKTSIVRGWLALIKQPYK